MGGWEYRWADVVINDKENKKNGWLRMNNLNIAGISSIYTTPKTSKFIFYLRKPLDQEDGVRCPWLGAIRRDLTINRPSSESTIGPYEPSILDRKNQPLLGGETQQELLHWTNTSRGGFLQCPLGHHEPLMAMDWRDMHMNCVSCIWLLPRESGSGSWKVHIARSGGVSHLYQSNMAHTFRHLHPFPVW